MTLVLWTSGDPSAIAPAARAAVRDVDPELPLTGVATMASLRAQSVSQPRFLLGLLAAFAVAALTLAAIGIYGVVSHATTQRSKELAMRLALGATPGGLVKLVITQGRGVALVGAVAGLAASYVGGRVVAARLVGVRAVDPLVLSVASVAVLGVALLGYLIPAARAARTQPAVSLRLE
jgi:putative ABC transport system permease protein